MSTSLLLYPSSEIIEQKALRSVEDRSLVLDATPVDFYEIAVRVGEIECRHPFQDERSFEGDLKFRFHFFREHPTEEDRVFCLNRGNGMLLVGILNLGSLSFDRVSEAAWKGKGLRLNLLPENTETHSEWRDGGAMKIGFESFGAKFAVPVAEWQLSFYF